MVEGITLVNTVTNAKLKLDMVNTPSFILGSVSWGKIKGDHHTYSYVGQVGETHASTTLGTRDSRVNYSRYSRHRDRRMDHCKD